jgi:hypothetical protein
MNHVGIPATHVGSSASSPSTSLDALPLLRASSRAPRPTRQDSDLSFTLSSRSAVDAVDGLRPPGLVYEKKVCSVKPNDPPRSSKSYISACGNYIVWIAKHDFWVFEIDSEELILLTCGQFLKGKEYRYGMNERKLGQVHEWKKRPEFTCAALSRSYCAIGTPDKLLVFLMPSGRFLGFEKFRDVLAVSYVCFSPQDGTELIALTTVKSPSRTISIKPLVYLTSNFPLTRSDSTNILRQFQGMNMTGLWEDFTGEIVDLRFSMDGSKIIICSDHDHQGMAHARLLERDKDGRWAWRDGIDELLVNNGNSGDSGIMGISLYRPTSLLL